MHTAQIALVRASWQQLTADYDEVAHLFYHRLFELAPESRQLLTGDIDSQGQKMIELFSITVAGLEGVNRLVLPVLLHLGQRHQCYGMLLSDDYTGEQAFLWALKQKLGSNFTPDLEAGWQEVYHLVSDTLQLGMREPCLH